MLFHLGFQLLTLRAGWSLSAVIIFSLSPRGFPLPVCLSPALTSFLCLRNFSFPSFAYFSAVKYGCKPSSRLMWSQSHLWSNVVSWCSSTTLTSQWNSLQLSRLHKISKEMSHWSWSHLSTIGQSKNRQSQKLIARVAEWGGWMKFDSGMQHWTTALKSLFPSSPSSSCCVKLFSLTKIVP